LKEVGSFSSVPLAPRESCWIKAVSGEARPVSSVSWLPLSPPGLLPFLPLEAQLLNLLDPRDVTSRKNFPKTKFRDGAHAHMTATLHSTMLEIQTVYKIQLLSAIGSSACER
jgi:hypothetical protein